MKAFILLISFLIFVGCDYSEAFKQELDQTLKCTKQREDCMDVCGTPSLLGNKPRKQCEDECMSNFTTCATSN